MKQTRHMRQSVLVTAQLLVLLALMHTGRGHAAERPSATLFSSITQCQLGDWIGIAVLVGIGLFSLTFLGLGAAVLAKYLASSDRAKQPGTI